MQTFLDQPEATFYHVCALNHWDSINANGLKAKKGKLFVSRVGELPVLAAIALEQIPDIYQSCGIAVFKLPQVLNNFTTTEIFEDNQAGDERTKVFQNIITRSEIPVGQFETVMKFLFLGNGLDILSSLSAQANMFYPNHAIYKRALTLQINKLPNIGLDKYWLNP